MDDDPAGARMTAEGGRGRMPRRLWWATAAIYGLMLVAGLATRDFGQHWDEDYQADMVLHTVESGSVLPGWYRYPSVTYWLSLASLAPAAVEHGFEREALVADVRSPRFHLRGRMLFLAVAYLALFWVALLAWRATRSPPTALLAVALLATSFEFHYHARWMATDAVNASVVALGVLLAVRYLDSGRRAHLVQAALAAGLAAGTKYPGGLVLVPLLLAVVFRHPRDLRAWLRLGALALGLTLLGFLVTTPGAALEWDAFERDIRRELRHYSERGHGPYSVEPGLDHLARMLGYLGLAALSYSPVVAASLAALALVGVAWLARRDGRLATLLAVLPVVYVLYFTRQRVMTVRNYQLMLPFLALLASVGALALARALAGPVARRAVVAALTLGLAWNVWWLVRADLSIVRRDAIDVAAQVERFVRRSEGPVFVGEGLRASLGEGWGSQLRAQGRLADTAAEAAHVVLFPRDMRPGDPSAYSLFRANQRGAYRLLDAGPWEVNWDYYPSWPGVERPLVIAPEYYLELRGG